MKKTQFIFGSAALALSLLHLSGCAQLMKGIGSAAGEAITQRTSSLKSVAVRAQYARNLYPKATGVAEVDSLEKEWETGKNVLGVTLFKQRGVGLYSIDGEATYTTAGGEIKPLKYMGLGSYWTLLEPGDLAPKTINLSTSTGEQVSIPMQPNAPIKIVSLNDKSENASMDLGQDVVLKLQMPPATDGSQLKVSLISYPMGIANFSDIGVFKAGNTLRIPAAAFRHPSVSGGAGVGSFGAGNNFLRVERFIDKGRQGIKGSAGAIANLSLSWDTVPVSVTGAAPLVDHIQVEAKGENQGYFLSKPNAFSAPPLNYGKRFAVSSLGIVGSLFDKETFSSTNRSGNYVTTTTTEITKQFPQLSDAHWDSLMSDLYKKVTQTFARRYQSQFLPLENVIRSRNYADLFSTEGSKSEHFIERQYKDTKDLLPQNIFNVIDGASSTFASDTPQVRLLNELKADGLLSMKLNLQVATDKEEQIVLLPVLKLHMAGASNGYMTATTYFSGAIYGQGQPFNGEQVKSNPALLTQIVNVDQLVKTLDQALTDLEAKEKEMGYQAIWANR